MTNTHINVGGHKITTNKVGQVQTAELESGVTGGTVQYCVTNGICCVIMGNITCGASYITKKLPTCKWGNGYLYVLNEASKYTIVLHGTELIASTYSLSGFYGVFSYPVADDWSE